MKIHPACACLPEMAEDEYEELKRSIASGWDANKEPILLFEGMLLDGRHRWKACKEVKVEPVLREWDRLACDGDPFLFVWQQHSARRNWKSDEQKLLCYDKLESMRKQAREAVEARANAARSEATKAQPRTPDGRRLASGGSSGGAPTRRDPAEKESRSSRSAVAAKAGVDRNAVQRVATLQKLAKDTKRPDIIVAVEKGKSARRAIEELKQEKRNQERSAVIASGVEMPQGLLLGDFRKVGVQIPDNSVSLFFTDPPYDRQAIKLFDALGELAAAKLAPGGSLICYVGHIQLPEAIEALGRHLRFWWPVACIHSGSQALMREYGIRVGWKPMLWYVKKTRHDPSDIIKDVTTGERQKEEHEWQQSLAEAEYYIEHLCPGDGIVCDPFLGSGTTAVAAKKLKRPWVGIEIDPGTAAKAARRIGKS